MPFTYLQLMFEIETQIKKKEKRLEAIRICSYERPFRTQTKNNDHIISLKTLKQSAQACDYPGNSLNTGQLQKGLLVSVLVKHMYIFDVRNQGMIQKPYSQMTMYRGSAFRLWFRVLLALLLHLPLVVQNSNIRFYGKETCKLIIYTCIM